MVTLVNIPRRIPGKPAPLPETRPKATTPPSPSSPGPAAKPEEPRSRRPSSRPADESPVRREKPAPSQPPVKAPLPENRGMSTIGIEGFDIKNLNIAKHNYHIELPDRDGKWVQLISIVGTVKTPVFGRNADPRLELMKSVALRHLRFENTSKGLFIQPFESLNGVYRQITRPVDLTDGLRFRLGNYILSYREPGVGRPAETLVHDGEHLLARDLVARGEVEFLRPDGRPGLRYPLLKAGATVFGRGGPDSEGRESYVDILLPNDPKISLRHAQVSFQGPERDQPVLQDLKSKSGTWVQVVDRSPVADGDVFWLGELYMRVVGAP
jgi:pSer/pThr/pTyr-binding forkhead associated (FHA) protein